MPASENPGNSFRGSREEYIFSVPYLSAMGSTCSEVHLTAQRFALSFLYIVYRISLTYGKENDSYSLDI